MKDKDQWRRIRAVFDEALPRQGAAREDLLSEACGGDDELRQQVERLLEAHAAAGTYSQPFLPSLSLRAMAAAPFPTLDTQRYRILAPLGEGGMGQVYLAERADDAFRKRVAVKVLRRGPGQDALAGRLRGERQLLARLEHPHIARLLDGGDTTDGRPYLVLELVEGEPIDIYCDARRLALEARLRLFQKVCRAVQHAHRNLIVHRDLKTSNVLVTADGEPKLLDFGIAKLLAPEDDAVVETLLFTLPGEAVMTPQYASPEQVRGEAVTTATDVYALGLLLFEILTGSRPYRVAGLAHEDVVRVICETPPPRPSTVEPRGDGERADPVYGRPLLAGDLDNIVLMALRKEPERRYASAETFADDVERYLVGLPVRARSDTMGYRAGKFLRRHLAAVAAAAAFVVLLAGFAVTSYLQARRIAAERDTAQAARVEAEAATARAERARDQAEEERRLAEKVQELTVELFYGADPAFRGQREEITAREALERGVARLDAGLADQPRLRASLLLHVSQIYYGMGLYEEARAVAERVVAFCREQPECGSTTLPMGLHYVALSHREMGDYRRATALMAEAVSLFESLPDPDPLRYGLVLNSLGILERRLGQLEAAATHFERALSINRDLGEENGLAAMTVVGNLAVVYRDLGSLTLAEERARQVVAYRESEYDSESLPTARNTLAVILLERGKVLEAADQAERAVAFWREVTPGHPYLAAGLNTLGRIELARGRYREARSHFQESLALLEATVGGGHPNAAHPLIGLARADLLQGNAEGAEKYLREALAIREAKLPAGHSSTLDADLRLADAYARLGHLEEARRLYEQVRAAVVVTKSVKARIREAEALVGLAAVAARSGDAAAAAALRRQGADIAAALAPDTDALRLRRAWALALWNRGERDRAAALARAIYEQGVRDPELEPLRIQED